VTISNKVIQVCKKNSVIRFLAQRIMVIVIGLLLIGHGLINPAKMLKELDN